MKISNDKVIYDKGNRVVISFITEELMCSMAKLNVVESEIRYDLSVVETLNSFPPIFHTNYTAHDIDNFKIRANGFLSNRALYDLIMSKGPGTVIWVKERGTRNHTSTEIDAMIAHEFYMSQMNNEDKSYFSRVLAGYHLEEVKEEIYSKQHTAAEAMASTHNLLYLLSGVQRQYVDEAKEVSRKITGHTNKSMVLKIYKDLINNTKKQRRLAHLQSLLISEGKLPSADITEPGYYKLDSMIQ